MLTHVVMFKLHDRSPVNIQKARECLLSMDGKIPQLRYLEVGMDLLHSERSYDLLLLTKFDSIEDMLSYQVHPFHLEVSEYISSLREAAVVVDYES